MFAMSLHNLIYINIDIISQDSGHHDSQCIVEHLNRANSVHIYIYIYIYIYTFAFTHDMIDYVSCFSIFFCHNMINHASCLFISNKSIFIIIKINR